MSTEQVLRKEIDHRSDIYSLGVMLFELITGQTPFQARSLVAAANKHVTEKPPDPRTLRPDLPDWLAALILRCLEKEPAARHQSVREILNEISVHESDLSDTLTGEGARNNVALAAPREAAPKAGAAAAVAAPIGVPPEDQPPAKVDRVVLIAEIDPDQAKVVRAKLESLGLVVAQAPAR